MSEWTKHKGGGSPVPLDAKVEVELRCGDKPTGPARFFRWPHLRRKYESDIIAYRIVEEEA